VTYNEEYNALTPRAIELRKIIEFVSANKVLRFKYEQVSLMFPELAKSGLIYRDGQITNGLDSGLANDDLFLFGLLQHWSVQLGYILSPDIEQAMAFCEQLFERFEGVQGVTKLTRGFSFFLLRLLIDEQHADLFEYGVKMRIGDNMQKFTWFYGAFFAQMLQSNDDFLKVWNVCKHYTSEIGNPKPDTYDMRWADLGKFLQVYFDKYTGDMQAVKQQIIDEPAQIDCEYLSMVALRVLTKLGILSTAELIHWLDVPELKERALDFLNLAEIRSSELRSQVVGKLDKLGPDLSNTYNVIRLWQSILSSAGSDNENAERCKDKLKACLSSKEPGLVALVLNVMVQGTNNADFFIGLCCELVSSEEWRDEYLMAIGAFFGRVPDRLNFFRFLRAYALAKRNLNIVTRFQSVIYLIKAENYALFERETLLMTIDDSGNIRRLGHEILFSGFTLNERATIHFDILSLDLLQQYKLAVSILFFKYPVQHSIPVVAPLLKSSSKMVREIVIAKMEELIQSYKYEVIEQLELLDQGLPDLTSIIAHMKAVLNELAVEHERKSKLKELDPSLTQGRELRQYMDMTTKRYQKDAEGSAKNSPGILQFATNVNISRGGGVILPDGSIQPLGYAGVTFTPPRTLFLAPEQNDYALFEFFANDWKKEFEKWEQTILSSGNT